MRLIRIYLLNRHYHHSVIYSAKRAWREVFGG